MLALPLRAIPLPRADPRLSARRLRFVGDSASVSGFGDLAGRSVAELSQLGCKRSHFLAAVSSRRAQEFERVDDLEVKALGENPNCAIDHDA
jgi:hypothetical protein